MVPPVGREAGGGAPLEKLITKVCGVHNPAGTGCNKVRLAKQSPSMSTEVVVFTEPGQLIVVWLLTGMVMVKAVPVQPFRLVGVTVYTAFNTPPVLLIRVSATRPLPLPAPPVKPGAYVAVQVKVLGMLFTT